jgi:DNA polymerase III delta subunit
MIFFFYGSNSFEARQQITRLMQQYEQKAGNTLGLERIDGAKATLAELRSSLQAAPFLANSRLVIVEQLGANKSLAGKVGALLEDIPSTTVAVFYDPAPDQRTIYFKTMSSSKAKVVEFGPLTQTKLQQWIERRVAAAGATIDRPAINRLLELAGEDQWRLANEIDKLINYTSGIDVAAVNAMVEPIATETIFTLVEAMTSGNSRKALVIYQELRTEGQSEMYILSMVIWQLSNLLLAKSAGKIAAPQLAKEAGMSPYVAGKMLAKRHLFSEEQLSTAFLAAVDTDYRIKSGGGDSDTLVERLIATLAASLVKS